MTWYADMTSHNANNMGMTSHTILYTGDINITYPISWHDIIYIPMSSHRLGIKWHRCSFRIALVNLRGDIMMGMTSSHSRYHGMTSSHTRYHGMTLTSSHTRYHGMTSSHTRYHGMTSSHTRYHGMTSHTRYHDIIYIPAISSHCRHISSQDSLTSPPKDTGYHAAK